MVGNGARWLIARVLFVASFVRRFTVCRAAFATILLMSLSGVAEASTTCSANVTFTGTGSGNAQSFDVFQSGNCDNDALGLFAGTNVVIASDAVGSSGPQTVTGSKGNTYTLEWSGPNPDTYTMILVNQVANGPETLTYSYFFDDGSANPGETTNAIFTINVTLPTLAPTVPGAPTIGTATRGNAQASIAFTAPASNGGSAITSYTATSSPGGFTGTGTTSPITVTGLTNGTAYTFTVTATNTVGTGNASAASNSVIPASVPGAPSIGTATGGNAQASIAFTAPASNGGSAITSYTASSSPGGFTGTSTNSPITVPGLTNGTAYTFTVTATNSIGTGIASSVSNSVTPATVPGAPTIGSAVPGNGQASVGFTPPASNGGSSINGYTATSSPGGFTGTSTTSPITVPGLTNGTAYTFTVRATNGVGTGTASATSNSVTPVTVPGAPTIGSATAGNAQATVTFTPPAANGGATITSYTVTSSPGGITASGSVSPITVTGLTNLTAYTFTVTANNTDGPGAPSAASNAVTPAPLPAITAIGPTSGPVAGGTSVTITGTGFTNATAVKFGTTSATSFNVNSATSITATSPVGTGTVDITVTTVGGTSATSAADQFAYIGAPTLTAISPSSGPATGGTSVTITGTNFSGVTAVKFGAVAATGFTVNSATSITATSPAGLGAIDITVTTASGATTASAGDRFTYQAATTSVTLASSVNPSNFGQAVTFTAKAASSAGTPGGTVTFYDAGVVIGSATLSGGVAAFTTSTLKSGAHSITGVYAGNTTFLGSVSTALVQTVNIPADSVRLHQLQVNVTKLVAQNSGAAISGAIDDAITEGFADELVFATPGQSGFRFNFAADPHEERDDQANTASASSGSGNRSGPFANGGANAYGGDMSSGGRGRASSRVDDAFAAIDQQMPRKAPPKKYREQQDWLFWIDVRGSGLDRLTTTTTAAGVTTAAAPLHGLQINALAGLTWKMRPNFLIGVVGGYENFNFTEQDINGKLTGDGWTVGSYLGWKITPTLRYNAAVAYSGIGYNGTAGTAQGNFDGNRWLVSTGLTGTYKGWGLVVEPSATVYALWENEGGYVDSLGTQQASHDFSTGRASAGTKVIYPFKWTDGIELAPYAGIYGDYYFNQDDATAIVAAGGVPLASTPLLQGWSARATAGLGARFASGAIVAVGAEYGGIGSDFETWTFKAKGQVPFSPQ